MQSVTLPSPEIGYRKLRVVHIISGDRWAGAEVQAFTLFGELKRHTELHVIVMNEGELAARCRSLGIATEVIDEGRMASGLVFLAIRRYLKKIQPDVVHTHRQKENIFGSVANRITCRARCIRTVHGAPEFSPKGKQKLQAWLETLCGRYFHDAIIAVNSDLQRALSNTFSTGKIHVIANGIDPAEVRRDISTPDFRREAPYSTHIGLVGRLDPVKRVDLFLEMAAILLRDKPAVQWAFHVFGEGRQEAAMRRLADTLGLNERVRFHGHRGDIRSCIAGLDAVVMPSDHEGLPMAALETLALGVRLIAHDTGGLSELLKNQQDCLVADHSAHGYADALSAALLEKPHPGCLAADYLASNNGKKILSLYRQC